MKRRNPGRMPDTPVETPQAWTVPFTRRSSRPLPRAIAVVAVVLATVGATGCMVEDTTPPPSGGMSSAPAQLRELTVAPAKSTRGYSRSRFPHWRSVGKNCDVRDTVLQRDGTDIKLSGCNVVGGRWISRYDNRTLASPTEVDIDHMVPLANAWRSGADEWDDDKRAEFANDLDRPQLHAVSATSNRAKGDQDPSQWKPPNRQDWCQYARDWIAVKYYWRLSVTDAEKAALGDMLGSC